MSYEIYLPQTFQRCIKSLRKKFPHIKDDLSPLFQSLQNHPQIGVPIPGWGRKIWKVRVSSRDLKSPHPSPLPAGEREGVRGKFQICLDRILIN